MGCFDRNREIETNRGLQWYTAFLGKPTWFPGFSCSWNCSKLFSHLTNMYVGYAASKAVKGSFRKSYNPVV